MLISQHEKNSAQWNIAGRECKLASLDLSGNSFEVQRGLMLIQLQPFKMLKVWCIWKCCLGYCNSMVARLHNALKLLTVPMPCIFFNCRYALGSHQMHGNSHNKLRKWLEASQTLTLTQIQVMEGYRKSFTHWKLEHCWILLKEQLVSIEHIMQNLLLSLMLYDSAKSCPPNPWEGTGCPASLVSDRIFKDAPPAIRSPRQSAQGFRGSCDI